MYIWLYMYICIICIIVCISDGMSSKLPLKPSFLAAASEWLQTIPDCTSGSRFQLGIVGDVGVISVSFQSCAIPSGHEGGSAVGNCYGIVQMPARPLMTMWPIYRIISHWFQVYPPCEYKGIHRTTWLFPHPCPIMSLSTPLQIVAAGCAIRSGPLGPLAGCTPAPVPHPAATLGRPAATDSAIVMWDGHHQHQQHSHSSPSIIVTNKYQLIIKNHW